MLEEIEVNCIIDCRKYQYLLLRGMKNTLLLTVWGEILPLLVWVWLLIHQILNFFTQKEPNLHIPRIFSTLRNLHLCVQIYICKFTNANLNIYVFSLSKPFFQYHYICYQATRLSSPGLSPSLWGKAQYS